jgi:non-heme chloroperoxidase
LGDDVLKVIDALKLDRPILAGHSIAGQELSSIGTRHPEKVAALIYLDAALSFAYYDPDENTLQVDIPTLRRDLEQLPKSAGSPSESIKLMNEMEATFPNLQKAFAQYRAMLAGLPELPPRPSTLQAQVQDAVVNNARRYTSIEPPILAIFAAPRQCTPNCGTPGNDAQQASVVAQANAFAAGNPSAHVVRLAYANHYLFRSNEADVIREMNAFMEGLPKGN